jgi:hypothetical protein
LEPQKAYNMLTALAQFASVDNKSRMNVHKATRALTRRHLHTIKLARKVRCPHRVQAKKYEKADTCNQMSTWIHR